MLNEAFGWFWISMGFATGAVLGLFFRRAISWAGTTRCPAGWCGWGTSRSSARGC